MEQRAELYVVTARKPSSCIQSQLRVPGSVIHCMLPLPLPLPGKAIMLSRNELS